MEQAPAGRYLFVTEYFHPHWTGIAKAFLNLAEKLVRDGNAVTVLTTHYNSILAKEEELNGVCIKRSPYLMQISRTQYSYRIILDFIKLVREFDIVVINSPYSNILFIAILSKIFRKKLVVFHQGDLILSRRSGSNFASFVIERIFEVFTISALALADVSSTCTEDYAKHSRVMKYFMHKFRALIPPIPLPAGGDGSVMQDKLAKLKSKGQLVGFAGRFVDEKGFDILLEAVPQLVVKFPNIHFVFAGETNIHYESFFEEHQDEIEKLRQHVTLLGLLAGNELLEFYHAIDVFVLCSRSDCFALTQAEAALCGVPVVVTDIPGARVMVKTSGFGEVVEVNNPQALACGIDKVLNNREEYLAKEKLAREFLTSYENLSID